MTTYTVKQLLEDNKDSSEMLWHPFFSRQGHVLLTGSSDIGKTSLARNLCYNIVTGHPEFLGFRLSPVHNRALYISTEDLPIDVAEAIKKASEGQLSEAILQRIEYCFDFTERSFSELEKYLLKTPVDVIVVDVWTDYFTGNANDQSQVRQSYKPFKEIASKYKLLVIFLHHTVKNAEKQAPNKSLVSGSQAIESSPRCVLELRSGDAPSQRLLTATKGNRISHELKSKSFILQFDERTLTFQRTGVRDASLNVDGRTKYQDHKLYDRYVELKKSNTFEKARELLVEEFKDIEVPSLTSLKNYYYKVSGRKASEIDPKDET